jgi:hypothetical protein
MIAELLTAVVTLGAGALTLRAAALPGWGVVPLGYLVGTSLLVLLATIQASLGLSTDPLVTHAGVLVVAGGAWAVAHVRGRALGLPLHVAAVVVGALVPLVWSFRVAKLARVTPDSFNLMTSGALLARDLLDVATPDFLEDWQIAAGAIHAVAHVNGEFYLRSAGPLAALATLGALVWAVERSLSSIPLPRRGIVGVAALAGLVLLTTQRFLYNAFYLNRHVVIAGLLLVCCVAAWGLVRGVIAPPTTLFVLLATALPGLVLGRAETPLVAGIVLLPVLASGSVQRRHRATLAAILGGVVVLWNGGLVARYAAAQLPVSTSAAAMLALGLASLTVAVLVARGCSLVDPLPRWTLLGVEAALWVAVFAGAALAPEVLRESIASTTANVLRGEGGWGVTLTVLGLLTLLVLLATHEGDRVQLRLPLTAFIPLALLLAYVRADGGLPYRVGLGDSFNRMLLHLVPLAVFYLATAPCAARWRHRWREAVPLDVAPTRATTSSHRRGTS